MVNWSVLNDQIVRIQAVLGSNLACDATICKHQGSSRIYECDHKSPEFKIKERNQYVG